MRSTADQEQEELPDAHAPEALPLEVAEELERRELHAARGAPAEEMDDQGYAVPRRPRRKSGFRNVKGLSGGSTERVRFSR